jgi:peptidylprolyl isomerase
LPERPPTSTSATPGEGDDLYDDYVDAQAENLTDATLDGVSLGTARCIGGAIVDVATVEALQEAGVTPEELADMQSLVDLDVELAGGPQGAIADLTSAFGACDFGTDLEGPLVESLGSDAGADIAGDDRDCVVEMLDDHEFELAVAETVVEGSESMVDEILLALGRCPGAVAELVITFITGGAGPGTAAGRACLEARLADQPGAARVIWEAGPEARELVTGLADACGLELAPGGTTPTSTEEPDDAPASPGQVGGGWDPDLGFDTGGDEGAGGGSDDALPGRSAPDPLPPPADTPAGAVEVVRMIAGSGPAAALGDEVVVHYVGVMPGGRLVDSSWDSGGPLTLPSLGDGSVIAGWEEGLIGVQAGERRRLVIGSEQAYGAAGNDTIPPNTPLAFEIDVVAVTPR